jgi:hypothetical protein
MKDAIFQPRASKHLKMSGHPQLYGSQADFVMATPVNMNMTSPFKRSMSNVPHTMIQGTGLPAVDSNIKGSGVVKSANFNRDVSSRNFTFFAS